MAEKKRIDVPPAIEIHCVDDGKTKLETKNGLMRSVHHKS